MERYLEMDDWARRGIFCGASICFADDVVNSRSSRGGVCHFDFAGVFLRRFLGGNEPRVGFCRTAPAQDDPLVPFASFRNAALMENRFITLIAPELGGHCAFISNSGGDERFWAEQRVIEFCAQHAELSQEEGIALDDTHDRSQAAPDLCAKPVQSEGHPTTRRKLFH
jgi:hypothetical protein